MEQSQKILVLILAVLVVTNSLILYNQINRRESKSKQEIEKVVEKTFTPQSPDFYVETVSRETGSLYKVVVNSGNNLRKLYVTSDGEYMTENPINISEYREKVDMRADFVECLEERGVKIYSDSDKNATIQQFQLLGGTQGFENIYEELDNQTREYFIDQGVTHVPITVYNKSIYEGIKTPEFYRNEIGCSYKR